MTEMTVEIAGIFQIGKKKNKFDLAYYLFLLNLRKEVLIMRTIKTLLIFLTLLCCNNIFSQPLVVIHLFGGYSLPAADLRGDIPAIYDTLTSSYRTKNGFNIGADGKLGLGKTRNVRLVFSITYHAFSNSSDKEIDNAGFEHIKINDTQIGLGIELALAPKNMIDPFVGADIISSFFGGSRKFDRPDGRHPNADLNAATRYGLAIGGGIDFMLFKDMGVGFVIGGKYHFANMLGKKAGNNFFINTNYDLNDDSKSINFASFYAGVTFDIGEPVKRKK